MASFISHSPAETEALGEAWGRSAQTGLVIGLSGDLGAGKTQLVKGLARGLGVPARVHSPTFALVNVYTGGRPPFFHPDVLPLGTPPPPRHARGGGAFAPARGAGTGWAARARCGDR